MNLLRTPKAKLLAAVALLVVLGLCAPSGQAGAVSLARWLLGGLCLTGLGLWLAKARPRFGGLEATPLKVKARTGLGPRSGLALVQAEGRTFLVAHGEGFAKIHPLPAERRPSRKARLRALSSVKEVLQ